MSDNDKRDARRDEAENSWPIQRRRVLQLTGAGIAGLGAVGTGSGVASAASNDCADGPFESTVTGATVNIGQIHHGSNHRW